MCSERWDVRIVFRVSLYGYVRGSGELDLPPPHDAGVPRDRFTYKAACQARGLLADDAEWHACMEERSQVDVSPSSLRELLCTILQFNHPSDAVALVEAFVLRIGDDLKRKFKLCDCVPAHVVRDSDDDAVMLRALVLVDLEAMLDRYDVKANAAGVMVDEDVYEQVRRAHVDLPHRLSAAYHATYDGGAPEPQPRRDPHLVRDELDFDRVAMATEYTSRYQGLQPAQRVVVDTVVAALDAQQGGCFFIDAPGGTGKTWCFNTLLRYVRQHGDPALAVASTGIAGLLLAKGRTAHSRFKLALKPLEGYHLRYASRLRWYLVDPLFDHFSIGVSIYCLNIYLRVGYVKGAFTWCIGH